MKTLAFLIAVTFAPTAGAIAPQMCARLLGVPVRHADKFDVYSKLDILTPLRAEFAHKQGHTYLYLRNEIPANLDGRAYRAFTVEVLYSFDPEKRGGLILEGVTTPGELPPAYVYRVILAHLLERYPYVNEITYLAFEASDNGQLKERLARGQDLGSAVHDLPSLDAFRAFGFDLESTLRTRESRDDEAYRGDVQITITVVKR